MRLAELQRTFRDALTTPDRDGSAVASASTQVAASPGLTAGEHVQIYRRAVLGSLSRALAAIYPVCRQLVGAPFFDGMCSEYIRQTPSRSADLGDYGSSFASFIENFAPVATLPYLADVARLEWHWHRAFHAADEVAFEPHTLDEVPAERQEQLLFALPVSAALLASAWPVHRIWQVNQADWYGDTTVDLDEGAVRLIVWRQGYDMRIDTLTDSEWQLLRAISENRSLGQLATLTATESLTTLLPACVGRGWISRFSLIAEIT